MRVTPPNAMTRSSHYGRIAGVYRWLEYIAFGKNLERARQSHGECLRGCRRVIVYGAGDGRCFASLLRQASETRFVSVDLDATMTETARRTVAALGAGERVEFICADARNVSMDLGSFDGVVTQFFLDCFSADELETLIPAISAQLGPGAPWLFADFAVPEKPRLARWRARAWIALLCTFFRWQAGHTLTGLPPMENLLEKHGLQGVHETNWSWGLIRAVVYKTPAVH